MHLFTRLKFFCKKYEGIGTLLYLYYTVNNYNDFLSENIKKSYNYIFKSSQWFLDLISHSDQLETDNFL